MMLWIMKCRLGNGVTEKAVTQLIIILSIIFITIAIADLTI